MLILNKLDLNLFVAVFCFLKIFVFQFWHHLNLIRVKIQWCKNSMSFFYKCKKDNALQIESWGSFLPALRLGLKFLSEERVSIIIVIITWISHFITGNNPFFIKFKTYKIAKLRLLAYIYETGTHMLPIKLEDMIYLIYKSQALIIKIRDSIGFYPIIFYPYSGFKLYSI